jgi:hypothetical protein
VLSRVSQLTSQVAPGEVSGRKVLGDGSNRGIPTIDNVTKLSGSNLLPDIRGREVNANSTKSRLEDRGQALAKPSSVSLRS